MALTVIFVHVSVAPADLVPTKIVALYMLNPSGCFLIRHSRLTPLLYLVVHNTSNAFRKNQGT
jgi:hypothetical protein